MIEPDDSVVSTTGRFGAVAKAVRVTTVAGVTQVLVEVPATGEFLTVPASELEKVEDISSLLAQQKFDPAHKFDLRSMACRLEIANQRTAALSAAQVDMLPHQVLTADRILSADEPNHLLADDVGMGKTIEVGLVLQALRARGHAKRILIIAPAGLTVQWQEQLEALFGLYCDVFNRDFFDIRADAWNRFPRVIASIDALKRKNRRPALEEATDWDFLVVDEAHKLTARQEDDGTIRRTQNYQLLERLRSKARFILFATATPHQGDDARFSLLLHLLRPDLFNQKEPRASLDGNLPHLREVMTRNLKSEVTDADGKPIFKGHRVVPVDVDPSQEEQGFLLALRTYVQTAYSTAEGMDQPRARILGLVMTTFLKLAASSPEAIRSALQNRLEWLTTGKRPKRRKETDEERDARFEGEHEERSENITGEAAFWDDEVKHLKGLVALAGRLESSTKSKEFLDRVVSIRQQPGFEGGILIFTEYRATQDMLVETLRRRFPDQPIALINGSMGLDRKKSSVNQLNQKGGFLVSTEAGGEGLNLHENCHVMFNFDLPWNPMRLQQRMGRLERYGQKRPVIVFNMRNAGTIEDRLRHYLDIKLEAAKKALAAVQDNPEDLHEAILGTLEAELDLGDLYRRTLLGSQEVKQTEAEIDRAMERVRKAAERAAQLFSAMDRFSLEDWGKVRPELTLDDVKEFVRGCFRGRKFEEVRPGVFSFITPAHLKDGRRIQSEYNTIVFDRELVKTVEDANLFTFGHPLFDRLVQHVQGHDHGGLLAKRIVTSPDPALVGVEGLQLNYVLSYRMKDGREVRTFEPVFVDQSLEIRPEVADLVKRVYSRTDWRRGPRFLTEEFRKNALELGAAEADRRLAEIIRDKEEVIPALHLHSAALVRLIRATTPGDDDERLDEEEESGTAVEDPAFPEAEG